MATTQNSELMTYLAANGCREGDQLPAIPELASELGISPGKLREQLEVARTMGLVEVRPRTGIRVQGYRFLPMLEANLAFALALESELFEQYGELRNQLEAAFWRQAVTRLEPDDIAELRRLVDTAWEKLTGQPIQIPHAEHRQLHLLIFRRLDNDFVRALLQAYWSAYEAVGLDLYADYSYLHQVWTYHDRIVSAIEAGDVATGHEVLLEHFALLQARPQLAEVAAESLDGRRAIERAQEVD